MLSFIATRKINHDVFRHDQPSSRIHHSVTRTFRLLHSSRFPHASIYKQPAKGRRCGLTSQTTRALHSSLHLCQRLENPSIIYKDNHLLVINKPAGWHAIPNSNQNSSNNFNIATPSSSKCLLSYLQQQLLGGGSQNTFLLPLHRLDQPVSGINMFAKTSKAASRIQSNWSLVQKDYVALVESTTMPQPAMMTKLEQGSCRLDDSNRFLLHGYLQRHRQRFGGSHTEESSRGWSVSVERPKQGDDHQQQKQQQQQLDPKRYRHVQLTWKYLSTQNNNLLVHIQTNQGARHLIRALFGSIDCPLAGDLRYGAVQPLPDKSVALHAYRIQVPDKIRLGTLVQREYVAQVPLLWKEHFGIGQNYIQWRAGDVVYENR